jgi:hypothetical protein
MEVALDAEMLTRTARTGLGHSLTQSFFSGEMCHRRRELINVPRSAEEARIAVDHHLATTGRPAAIASITTRGSGSGHRVVSASTSTAAMSSQISGCGGTTRMRSAAAPSAIVR